MMGAIFNQALCLEMLGNWNIICISHNLKHRIGYCILCFLFVIGQPVKMRPFGFIIVET